MANIPLPTLLSLANELNRISLAASPFYEIPLSYRKHPHCLALVGGDPPHQHFHAPCKQAAGPLSTIGKDGFQVCMDVQQFKPNELNVKVLDNCVIVEGKHEEREDDHGYISRNFVRRYALPKGYDPDKVMSTLSSDGVLTVSVPKPQIEDKSGERVIQIQQVGPAHLNVKHNSTEQIKSDTKEEAEANK